MDLEARACPTCTAKVPAEASFCPVCGSGLKRPEWGWQDFREATRLVACNPGNVALLSLLMVTLLAGVGLIGDRLYAALSATFGWAPSLSRGLAFLWILGVLLHIPLAGVDTAFLSGVRTGRVSRGQWAAVRRSLGPILATSGLIGGLWLLVGLALTRLVGGSGWPAGMARLIQAGGWFLSGVWSFAWLHLALLEVVDRGSGIRLALRRAWATLRRGAWPLLGTIGLAWVVGLLGMGVLGIGVLLTGPLALSVLARAYLRLSPVGGAESAAGVFPELPWRLPRVAWIGLGGVSLGLTVGMVYGFARVPWHSASCRRSGDRLVAAGEAAQAVPYYQEWVRWQPRNAAAHSALARALSAAQQWKEAQAEYEMALRLSETVENHLALADFHYNHGDREQALAHYVAALRLDPNSVDAQLALADMLYERGELETAAAAYEKALQLSPENPTAFHNLGQIRDQLKQTDLAIAAYQEAARLGSEFPETYTSLAADLKKRGLWDQAVQCYEAAVRLQPQDGNLLKLLQEARDHAAWAVLGTGPMAGLELTILSTQVNAVAGKAQGAGGLSDFKGVFLFVEFRLRNVTDRKIPSVTWPDRTLWLQVGKKKIFPTLLYTGSKMIRLNDPRRSWQAPVVGSLPPGASRDRALLFPGREFPTGATQGIFQGNHFPPLKVGWEG